MALLNFNATTVPPNSAFDPLPAGWYIAKIVASETKPVNPPKTGSYLALTFEIIDGQYVGRKVFTNLNLENENPVAVKIAYEQLSALCYVTGVINCQDSQQLHGIPLQIKLSIRPAAPPYDASNDVKGFRNQLGQDPKDIASGASPTTTVAPAPPSPPAAPVAPSSPAQPPAPPAAPPTPPVAPSPPPPPHDPIAAAIAAGWVKHPAAEGWFYKGQEVKSTADVIVLFPAQPPAPPAAPPVAPGAGGPATPPWARPAA